MVGDGLPNSQGLPSRHIIIAHQNQAIVLEFSQSKLHCQDSFITMSSAPQLATSSAFRNLLGLASRQLPKVASTAPARSFSTTPSSQKQKDVTLLQDKANGFGFARSNPRPAKPRSTGVTEIRGPYYSVCELASVQWT